MTMFSARFSVSEEEQSFITMMATRSMMSQSEYIRACFDEPNASLNRLAALRADRYIWCGPVEWNGQKKTQKKRKREICVRISEAQERVIRERAKKEGVEWRTWMRMRATGEPPRISKRRQESEGRKRGRPTSMSKLREEIAASGGALTFAATMNSPDAMKAFYVRVFESAGKAGVRMGDEKAIFGILSALANVEYVDVLADRSTDPNVAAPTRQRLAIKAYSPRHGIVEVTEMPPDVKRKRTRLMKKEKTMRL